ncbi:YafY family transcriptional regulator [Streptomyces sp. HU2014]|uniref:helix-turn-helix transcriptional regulator n=1 Tax=Streptomyces sp. HU2014 TaxID=2939414 RepID=UPI00200F2160|nr:YafY family protein [Streptomyces sp. HU2014]UQI47751.1 YafY family transcriptional regulator [Streptomyces sp. HU2014]
MKSDRLLSILLLLQTRGRVTAAELAERLDVSVRTIYRDIDSLSTAGVPVYAERGRHGGVALLPGFRTDVTGLTADEARALFVLASRSAHADLGLDGALGSALRKVMAALPAPHRPAAEATSRRILVDPVRWLTGPAAEVRLDELNAAVFADRRLRLRYRHGGESEPKTYTVDPYGLVAKAGVWYLVADRRARPRLFRADRVAAVTVTDRPVRHRPGVELADAWEELRRRVERRPAEFRVTATVRRARLDMFLRIAGYQLAGPPSDGDPATVELLLPEARAARQLLSFGPDVEVLAPEEVREDLAAVAARTVELYGGGGRSERAGAPAAGLSPPRPFPNRGQAPGPRPR